jgi:DNA-directed RNA polymerase specialized sigma24 family protein
MDDAGEDDDHKDGADDAPPPSIAPYFDRRGPPTAEEWRRFKLQFMKNIAAYTRLAVYKLEFCGVPKEHREVLCQEAFTRVFAFVRRWNVPTNLSMTVSSTTWRTAKGFMRDERRKAWHTRGRRLEREEAQPGAEPIAHWQLLLLEGLSQLPAEDADLLRWAYVEEWTAPEIAAWLGVPVDTASSRIRAARLRLKAILDQKIEAEHGQ